jgi:hypothetical protein
MKLNMHFSNGPHQGSWTGWVLALFYQKHWDLLEEGICSAVKGFLLGADIPDGFYDSIIVLIPKVNNVDSLSNFRPISLCNVIYKMASKVVANG